MRGLTRAGWVAGAAALSLALAACGGGEEEAAESPAESPAGDGVAAGSVVINGCTPQNPLVPADTGETCGGTPLDGVFTMLTEYSPEDASPYNAVAEEFASDDNQTWTITLKEGFTFHDGTPVTAQSFVDAWNYAAYGPNAQYNQYFFGPDVLAIAGFEDLQPEGKKDPASEEMSGLTAVDDLTLEVELDRPFALLPTVVGYSAFAPLPEVFFDDPKAFGRAPVGNGPFELVSYTPKEEIVLTAYDDYTGEDKPSVKDITFRIYQDTEAAYQDLLANNLDLLDDIPTSALAGETFKSDLGDRQVVQPQGVIQTMSIDMADPDFGGEPSGEGVGAAGKDLRLAVSKAIDREAVTTAIFEGTATPADSFVSPVVDGYTEGACGDACVFDAEGAQAALEAAGGFDGTMTLSYNGDGDHKAWTEAVCNSVSQTLGFDCVAQPVVDFSTFRAQITAEEMEGWFRTGWQFDYPNAENFLAPLYTTGASSNDGEYSNPAFDDLINEAAQAESVEEATALYQQAEQVLVEDFPVVPLWFTQAAAGWSENVESVTVNAFGRFDLPSIQLAG